MAVLPSGFSMLGQGKLAATLTKIGKAVPIAGESALRVEAELIRTLSMRLTPVRTGALMDSTVADSGLTFSGPWAVVGVGGPATPYAVAVHEDLMGRIPRPGGKGQRKFLETAANQRMVGMERRVGERIATSIAAGRAI